MSSIERRARNGYIISNIKISTKQNISNNIRNKIGNHKDYCYQRRNNSEHWCSTEFSIGVTTLGPREHLDSYPNSEFNIEYENNK